MPYMMQEGDAEVVADRLGDLFGHIGGSMTNMGIMRCIFALFVERQLIPCW